MDEIEHLKKVVMRVAIRWVQDHDENNALREALEVINKACEGFSSNWYVVIQRIDRVSRAALDGGRHHPGCARSRAGGPWICHEDCKLQTGDAPWDALPRGLQATDR